MGPEAATTATEIIKSLSQYGFDLSKTLLPIGLGLTGALLIIKVAWEGFQIAFGMKSTNDGMANLLLTLAIGGTLIMLFAPGPAGLYANFITIIDTGFDAIARALTKSGPYDTSQVTNLLDPLFRVINTLWGMAGKLWAQINPITAPIETTNAVLQGAVLFLFAVFYMVIFGVALVTFIMASIVFSIGVAFGPVLIPWVLFKPLEPVMDRWFWFVVTAGFQKIMILVILLMGAQATEKIMQDVSTSITLANAAGKIFAKPDPFLMLFLIGVLLLMLILKSEALTNALLPGHGAIGLAGMMKGAAAVGRGASGLAKGAANVGKATAKGAAALTTATKNTAQFGQTVTSTAARLSSRTGMSVQKATAKVIGRKLADSKVGAAASAVGNKAKAWAENPFKNRKAHGTPNRKK